MQHLLPSALREEAHHSLIRLLVTTGQKAAALHQYQELERILAQELGATPDPAIHALLEAGRHRGEPVPSHEESYPPVPETETERPRPGPTGALAFSPLRTATPAALPTAAPQVKKGRRRKRV